MSCIHEGFYKKVSEERFSKRFSLSLSWGSLRWSPFGKVSSAEKKNQAVNSMEIQDIYVQI